MKSEFWIFIQAFLIVMAFKVWIDWEYLGLYSGFICWILLTIIWGIGTLNIINIFPEE